VATATAAAQTVRIIDVLDGNLDWNTLSIGDSSHPDKLSVSLDASTRAITWTFTQLNLKPNVTPPEGQGWVEFTVTSASTIADGTTISNQANIYFDLNAPIKTNTVQRTIDRTAPSSAVAALASTSSTTGLSVSWSGTDSGCGVENYTVYVSRDDASYSAWLEQTTSTSSTYTGESGHAYKFYSVARDKLGNTESAPSQADATTSISSAAANGAAPPCCGTVAAITVCLCLLGMMLTRCRRGS
jgi:hypothetical protein